jgi:hypothetical protein
MQQMFPLLEGVILLIFLCKVTVLVAAAVKQAAIGRHNSFSLGCRVMF